MCVLNKRHTFIDIRFIFFFSSLALFFPMNRIDTLDLERSHQMKKKKTIITTNQWKTNM